LPDAQRVQVLEEALASTREIRFQYVRIPILLDIASHLPEPRKGQVIEETLAVLEEYGRATPVGSELGRLADHLSSGLMDRALKVGSKLRGKSDQAMALTIFGAHRPASRRMEVLQDALAAARKIREPRARGEALCRVAAELPEPQKSEVVQEALATSREIERNLERAQLLGALAPHLPEKQLSQVLDEALAAARDGEEGAQQHRSEVLAQLALLLPETQQASVMAEALTNAGWSGEYWERDTTLSKLAPALATMPAASLYPLWCEVLQRIETGPRVALLSDFYALMPAIVSLGGSERAAEIFRAIQDVGRWWP
jgi:hypothetical protein